MEKKPSPEKEGGEGEEEEEKKRRRRGETGPEGALGKNPFHLTAEDVYDISYVVGRDLMAITGDSRDVATRVTQLQFKIVRILEMLEALVNDCNVTVEELRMERDSLRKEVEGLRSEGQPPDAEEVDPGTNKVVVDLTDPNRPRFTMQELRDVLHERNKLKSQLLVAQEELQCYKSGLIPPNHSQMTRRDPEAITSPANSKEGKQEKTIIRKLFSFRSGKRT
ncbi:LOW QUALITY PROTEIN: RILP-like protein 2 [Antechinus flavipes]|uniref:LOW QUALITY PROTEIN: RILP-like protein 2 n=1 Tax=Antechinus flavipes TaxID=38775 RepID=UPI0022365F18|nr:LOW QUALITY PROTEIN: RILP-like protein 2 [Antechinus flavipes]